MSRAAVAWTTAAVVVAAAGFAAGRATFDPPSVREDAAPAATHTVRSAEVGRSSTFRVAVDWPTRTVAVAAVPGVVTQVEVDPVAVVESGQVLLRVDERPVVVAEGEVPAFRDLGPGATGRDVRQLQELLRSEGFATGGADGVFGSGTGHAVRAWQRATGLPVTGAVGAGDLVFVPRLPARVVLTPDVAVGQRLDEGVATVEVVLDAPRLTISPDGNAAVPAPGTPVVVEHDGRRWEGVTGSVVRAEAAEPAMIDLTAPDGGPICGSECGSLPWAPSDGPVTAEVELVPRAVGPAVPVAALGQDVDGGYVVTTPSGEELRVDVVATDGSRAVVRGIDVGQEVLLRVGPPDASRPPGKIDRT